MKQKEVKPSLRSKKQTKPFALLCYYVLLLCFFSEEPFGIITSNLEILIFPYERRKPSRWKKFLNLLFLCCAIYSSFCTFFTSLFSFCFLPTSSVFPIFSVLKKKQNQKHQPDARAVSSIPEPDNRKTKPNQSLTKTKLLLSKQKHHTATACACRGENRPNFPTPLWGRARSLFLNVARFLPLMPHFPVRQPPSVCRRRMKISSESSAGRPAGERSILVRGWDPKRCRRSTSRC